MAEFVGGAHWMGSLLVGGAYRSMGVVYLLVGGAREVGWLLVGVD